MISTLSRDDFLVVRHFSTQGKSFSLNRKDVLSLNTHLISSISPNPAYLSNFQHELLASTSLQSSISLKNIRKEI